MSKNRDVSEDAKNASVQSQLLATNNYPAWNIYVFYVLRLKHTE